MQNMKIGAFGLALGAMLVFLPLAGKLNQAKDQETRLAILMDITCVMSREELEEKLEHIVIPKDVGKLDEGQNKVLWENAKANLIAECYE